MSEPIAAHVIAAARAAHARRLERSEHGEVAAMRDAIAAADDKRGIRVEVMRPDPQSSTQFAPQWRYISDWRPVEEPS